MSEQGSAVASVLSGQTDGIERAYKFRRLAGLTNTVLVISVINIVTALVVMGSLTNQWRLLARMGEHLFGSRQAMMAAAAESDSLVNSARAVFTITLILTYIAGGLWLYRAACNVRAMGAHRLRNTPGWAVGWYFIPVMSLFKPFGAMVEIWNASLAPDRWRSQPVPVLLRWWWGLWMAVDVSSALVMFMAKAAKTIAFLILLTEFGMANMVLDVAARLVFLIVVLRIARMQTNAPVTASQAADVFS